MVFIIDDELRTYTKQDFAKFEEENNITLPDKYKQFMSELGAGIYCGFLRVHALEDVMLKTQGSRELWEEYPDFFWPHSNNVITQAASMNCYDLADSIAGDVMGYDPISKRFIIFPRHSDNLFFAEGGFDEPLNWSNEYIDMSSMTPKTFAPVHDIMSKWLVLEKTDAMEDLSLHGKSIEAFHQNGEFLRISEEDVEIIYSKRWAGEMHISKFPTAVGDRLRVNLNFNKSNLKQVESDLKKLFSSEYKIIASEYE